MVNPDQNLWSQIEPPRQVELFKVEWENTYLPVVPRNTVAEVSKIVSKPI